MQVASHMCGRADDRVGKEGKRWEEPAPAGASRVRATGRMGLLASLRLSCVTFVPSEEGHEGGTQGLGSIVFRHCTGVWLCTGCGLSRLFSCQCLV